MLEYFWRGWGGVRISSPTPASANATLNYIDSTARINNPDLSPCPQCIRHLAAELKRKRRRGASRTDFKAHITSSARRTCTRGAEMPPVYWLVVGATPPEEIKRSQGRRSGTTRGGTIHAAEPLQYWLFNAGTTHKLQLMSEGGASRRGKGSGKWSTLRNAFLSALETSKVEPGDGTEGKRTCRASVPVPRFEGFMLFPRWALWAFCLDQNCNEIRPAEDLSLPFRRWRNRPAGREKGVGCKSPEDNPLWIRRSGWPDLLSSLPSFSFHSGTLIPCSDFQRLTLRSWREGVCLYFRNPRTGAVRVFSQSSCRSWVPPPWMTVPSSWPQFCPLQEWRSRMHGNTQRFCRTEAPRHKHLRCTSGTWNKKNSVSWICGAPPRIVCARDCVHVAERTTLWRLLQRTPPESRLGGGSVSRRFVLFFGKKKGGYSFLDNSSKLPDKRAP